MDVAVERFRNDGIAGSALAAIMKDPGLTNGAFYPHFPSKADLVRETVSDALSRQAIWLREVLDEGGLDHLRDVLGRYAAYYNQARTHLALGKRAPLGRSVQRSGAIVAIPVLSGLHHYYVRI